MSHPHFSSSIEHVDHKALLLARMSVVRRSGAHAPNCSVTDCDEDIERFFVIWRTQHVHVGEEEWAFGNRDVADGREITTECAVVLRRGVRKKCAL